MKAKEVIDDLRRRFPHEPEYLQAVEEVVTSIEDVYNEHPEFERYNLIERLCLPDRIFSFRVSWVDDKGRVQNNMGYRIQHNNAIGPYKGGIRFHSSVNQSILKFLAFEQTFKNSLTTLPMGGGKGGSDFNPKGKSDMEVMRFCQAFIAELWRHIGPDTDVPAGDIGVGGREVGYMYGMYKKMARENTGTFTGKGLEFGGSLIRPEATGYGNVYFLLNMLATRNIDIKGKTVAISGSGNVATYTAKKLLELGAKVVTMSDSNGTIYVPEGLTEEQLDFIFELKNIYRGRIREFAEKYGCEYFEGGRPKILYAPGKAAIAGAVSVTGLEMAQNSQKLTRCIKNHGDYELMNAKILYAPGKAANAGGVSVSGLEMAQNSQKLTWTAEEVDAKLKAIMADIHAQCQKYGKEADGYTNYVKGANIAGFMKVAKAMMSQGIL